MARLRGIGKFTIDGIAKTVEYINISRHHRQLMYRAHLPLFSAKNLEVKETCDIENEAFVALYNNALCQRLWAYIDQ